MRKTSPIRLRLAPKQVRPFPVAGATETDLSLLGVTFQAGAVADLCQASGYSMDAAPAFVTAANAGLPVQFMQTIVPQVVQIVTAARKIDTLVGRIIIGNWHDEEIVQPVVEPTGRARPYGDSTDVPLSAYNTNFVPRTVVRFEQGAAASLLQDERASAAHLNALAIKRAGAANSLAIEHNHIGFYGYNNGDCRTYGFLNDPNLPAYVTAPATGASSATYWRDKDFDAITGDIRLACNLLRVQSGDQIDPMKDSLTLALPTSCIEELNKINTFGLSVRRWLADTYPNVTIESAPELDKANGGLGVMYLYADTVPGYEEGGRQRVLDQMVPAAVRLIGVEKRAKGDVELYSSATAGFIVKTPYGIVRLTGISE